MVTQNGAEGQEIGILVQITREVQDLTEQIRQRAYELYELRGRADGHELDDWLLVPHYFSHSSTPVKLLTTTVRFQASISS